MFGKPRSNYGVLSNHERLILKGIISDPIREWNDPERDQITALLLYNEMKQFLQYGSRELFIDRNASLLSLSSTPSEITWGSFKGKIFSSFVINIPQDATLHDDQWGKLKFVIVSYHDKWTFPKGVPIELLANKAFLWKGFMLTFFWEKTSCKSILCHDDHYATNIKFECLYSSSVAKTQYAAVEYVFNIFMLLQHYPQYQTRSVVRQRTLDSERTLNLIECRYSLNGPELKLSPTVLNHIANEFTFTGRKMPTHWRRPYWRRQVHGSKYVVESDVKVGTFEDGRNWHYVLIPPVLVNNPNEHSNS